jgi:hypothetical protein
MPGASHGIVDDDAVGERTVVVSAMRADGEDLVARTCEHHIVVIHMSEQQVAVSKRRN